MVTVGFRRSLFLTEAKIPGLPHLWPESDNAPTLPGTTWTFMGGYRQGISRENLYL